MSSLFSRYIQEREGKNIIEKEHGFLTYFFVSDTVCYVEDIFVVKEQRRSGLATELGKELEAIAKEAGIKKILGSVDLKAKTKTESMKFLLDYGFELKDNTGSLIYLIKDVQ